MPKKMQHRDIFPILERIIEDLDSLELADRHGLPIIIMGYTYPDRIEDLIQRVLSPETVDYIVDVIADDVVKTDQVATMLEEIGNHAIKMAEFFRAHHTIADIDIENLERRKRELKYMEKIDVDENYKMNIGFAMYKNYRKR